MQLRLAYILAGLWVEDNDNWKSENNVCVCDFTPYKVLSHPSSHLLVSPTSPDLPESGPKSLEHASAWVI